MLFDIIFSKFYLWDAFDYKAAVRTTVDQND